MTIRTRSPVVEAYLAELREAAGDLPRPRRRELLAQIEEHLAEAIPAEAADATARIELDRLGDPDQIVAEESDRMGSRRRTGRAFEWTAVILLLVGGFIVAVGWFVGVAMLWSSPVWTLRDKLIGMLLLPGGLAGPFTYAAVAPGATPSNGGAGEVLLGALAVVLLLTPLFTAVYLSRRILRPAR